MYSVSIDFEGHKVAGWADLCGPYAECEGSEVTSVTPANNDKDFRDRALSAVEEAAYKQHQDRFEHHYSASDWDAGASSWNMYDHPDTQVGPDYWRDPESGEYRCG